MEKGFVFNDILCVDCKACSAACIIENGWTTHPREIFTFNSSALPSLPVVHLSLACNHCEKPVCLEGCPSGSFSREPASGGIIVDENKCIGCSYCKWNCPYDAPKINLRKGIIEKCNLCYRRLSEGLEPACTSACPTGALSYGTIPAFSLANRPGWFPDLGLNPSLWFTGAANRAPLKIIPDAVIEDPVPESGEKTNDLISSWSLIVFTFLSTVSVALVLSSLINGNFRDILFIAALLSAAAITSFFHLGRKLRAWRAVLNIRSSPLSREIVLFVAFSVISTLSIYLSSPAFLIVSCITGLILLLVIDSVYVYSGNSPGIKLHPGQTFLSGLVLTSLFSGTTGPFIFLAFIKLILTVNNLQDEKKNSPVFILKFFRIALLLISTAGFATGLYSSISVIYAIIIACELFDRVIFYHDFKPENIKSLIIKNINKAKNEKKIG